MAASRGGIKSFFQAPNVCVPTEERFVRVVAASDTSIIPPSDELKQQLKTTLEREAEAGGAGNFDRAIELQAMAKDLQQEVCHKQGEFDLVNNAHNDAARMFELSENKREWAAAKEWCEIKTVTGSRLAVHHANLAAKEAREKEEKKEKAKDKRAASAKKSSTSASSITPARQFFAGTASSSPVQPTPTKPTKPTTFTASTPHESDRPRKPKEFVVSVPELIVCSQLVSFPMAEHPCGLILLAGTKRPDRFQVRIQFVHEEGRQNL